MAEVVTSPDEEVIARILEGEKDLYAIIVRRYNQRLYKVGISIIDDDLEVEDAMQVAYINAYQNLRQFGGRSAFSTWLTRIFINECYLRLKKRAKTIIMNDEKMENAMRNRQNEVDTPVSQVVNKELKNVLEDAIRKLPEMYRVVFVMREIENMNVAETQECLAISESNVKVRLNRAKAMLRDLLTGYYNKEELLQFHLLRCDKMVERVMGGI